MAKQCVGPAMGSKHNSIGVSLKRQYHFLHVGVENYIFSLSQNPRFPRWKAPGFGIMSQPPEVNYIVRVNVF